MTKHINIDKILDMEQVGDVVNSQFEVHTLGEEPDIECMHIEKWAKERAKQQLYDLMLEIIGEDEPVITKIGKGSISRGTVVFTNRLRQEQRQKLTNLFKEDNNA